jgi:tetratricopeptide (TPR) repeat protein
MKPLSLALAIAVSVAASVMPGAIADEDVDSLMLQAESERQKGNYAVAEKTIQQAMRILQSSSRRETARLSAAYNYLALIENSAGKYVESERDARKAIEFAKEAGLDAGVIAMHSVVLANALRQQGKYLEAEKILQDALPILDKPSTNQALLGTALNNLGAIYFWLGDYERALPLLEKGLRTRLAALGPEHGDVANSYLDLGATEFKLGDTQRAIEHVSDSARIREKAFGAKHPETLASVATLAVILHSKGSTAQASALLRKVVADARQALGQRHPDLAQYEDDYANVLAAQKSFDEARAMERDATRIRKQVFGASSREYAASLRSLAQIETAAGDTAKAAVLLKESAAVYKAAAQPGDPDYADTLDDLAAHYVSVGDVASASIAFTESAALREQGGRTVAQAVTLANLADVLWRMDRRKESMEALKKSREVIDALPEPLKTRADCASILKRFESQSKLTP